MILQSCVVLRIAWLHNCVDSLFRNDIETRTLLLGKDFGVSSCQTYERIGAVRLMKWPREAIKTRSVAKSWLGQRRTAERETEKLQSGGRGSLMQPMV